MTTDRVHKVLQYVGLERPAPKNEVDRAWRMLGRKTQRQISRLGRRGRPHPDPQVRSVAIAWAKQKCSEFRAGMVASAVTVVVYVGLLVA